MLKGVLKLHKEHTNSVRSSKKPGEDRSSISTAKITIPPSSRLRKIGKVDEMEIVKIRFGGNVVDGIYDSDARISVIRADLVKDIYGEGEGRIEIASPFGESDVKNNTIENR